MRSRPLPRAFALALVLVPVPLLAQVKAGNPFRLNTYTTGDQLRPALGSQPDGSFVVAWRSDGQDGSQTGIFGQRFDGRGVFLGAEFRVNSYTTGPQGYNIAPAVGVDDTGKFIVGWAGRTELGGGKVVAQRFDRRARPLGGSFFLSADTSSGQLFAGVGMNGAGDFVATWTRSAGSPTTSVNGRLHSRTGEPVGGDFQVNTTTTGALYFPAAAMNVDGRFLVAWETPRPGAPTAVRNVAARFFAADGTPTGDQFLLNAYTTSGGATPAVEAAPDGSFVVVWESFTPRALLARRFAGDGSPLGGEFRVDEAGAPPVSPSVAFDATGRFVVAWYHLPGGPTTSVQARRFDAAAAPLGGQFQVTADTATESAFDPSVACDRIGNFVVAWSARPAEGESDAGVRAQRFGGLLPVGIAINDGANGVLEVGDVFALGTTWRNTVGSAQAFQGKSSAVTAPAGLTLTLTADASYAVPDGAAGACSAPCFSGDLSGTRAAGHLDARFREDILPVGQGQSQPWTLHIGDSFADVPRSNGFYRFVETLLHRGVTAGCGGDDYCPGASTARDQMAVFVLVSAEGADYAPPACTTPMFGDVPASSPFCRWVEELARRGVVAGCGGGNYCPNDAVTRDQMAVFLLRTLDPALSPPACTTPMFGDVPASSPFCRWVEELARRGITAGCGGGNYCPTQPVTREQMAAFLTATFGLTLYGP